MHASGEVKTARLITPRKARIGKSEVSSGMVNQSSIRQPARSCSPRRFSQTCLRRSRLILTLATELVIKSSPARPVECPHCGFKQMEYVAAKTTIPGSGRSFHLQRLSWDRKQGRIIRAGRITLHPVRSHLSRQRNRVVLVSNASANTKSAMPRVDQLSRLQRASIPRLQNHNQLQSHDSHSRRRGI